MIPQFRELMLADETELWKLRFWFSGTAQTPSRFELVAKIRADILHEQPDTHAGVEAVILQNTDEAHAFDRDLVTVSKNGKIWRRKQ